MQVRYHVSVLVRKSGSSSCVWRYSLPAGRVAESSAQLSRPRQPRGDGGRRQGRRFAAAQFRPARLRRRRRGSRRHGFEAAGRRRQLAVELDVNIDFIVVDTRRSAAELRQSLTGLNQAHPTRLQQITQSIGFYLPQQDQSYVLLRMQYEYGWLPDKLGYSSLGFGLFVSFTLLDDADCWRPSQSTNSSTEPINTTTIDAAGNGNSWRNAKTNT